MTRFYSAAVAVQTSAIAVKVRYIANLARQNPKTPLAGASPAKVRRQLVNQFNKIFAGSTVEHLSHLDS
jgi:hypothetical protein